MRRVVEACREAGRPVAGFWTTEIREGGARRGFLVETPDGRQAVLAHVDLPGPPRVGRYGVDLQALESLALPAIGSTPPGALVVVDEVGPMELRSARLREAVAALVPRDVDALITVHSRPDPFAERLVGGNQVVRLTVANRDETARELIRAMASAP